jgi:hypothetical protein
MRLKLGFAAVCLSHWKAIRAIGLQQFVSMTGIDRIAIIGCERWGFLNFGHFLSSRAWDIGAEGDSKPNGWTDRDSVRREQLFRGPIPGAGPLVARNELTRAHGRH